MNMHRMTHADNTADLCNCALKRNHTAEEYASFKRHPSNRKAHA